jgi:hypothetical protein
VLQSIPGWLGPSYRRRTFRGAGTGAPSCHAMVETRAGSSRERISACCVAVRGDGKRVSQETRECPGSRTGADASCSRSGKRDFALAQNSLSRSSLNVAATCLTVRWLADLILGLVGARWIIRTRPEEFLTRLLETNSTRVQSDILNRVQESRGKLETEIRKLLHEVSRIAEQALARARKVREEGAPAVHAALQRLDCLEAGSAHNLER